jgi:hypothetical protein
MAVMTGFAMIGVDALLMTSRRAMICKTIAPRDTYITTLAATLLLRQIKAL